MKRWIAILLLAVLLCGCGSEAADSGSTTPDGDDTLWILTEKCTTYALVKHIAQQFQEEYPDVTIRLETLPSNAEEREVYLEQLKVQIMAGKGPDIYLLPVENFSSSQVFPNFGQCMQNGIFLDISPYYDADTALNKDGFVSAVMDAGVIDDARYILPLQYDYPVAYVDVQQLERVGLSPDDMDDCLNGMTEVVQTLGSSALAANYSFAYFQLHWLCFLPELMDYEAQEVTLEKEQLTDFLNQYRDLMTAVDQTTLDYAAPHFSNYMNFGEFWALDGVCVQLGSLKNLIYNLRIAKATGTELAVIPVRATDGSLTADVVFYGAVGTGCGDPELAYTFLRQFLLEENQWENNLSEHSSGLLGDGWPVLTEGSWSDLSDDFWRQEVRTQYQEADQKQRRTALLNTKLTAEDFSVLDTQIDVVQLPFAAKGDYMEMIDSRLNPSRNPDAMRVDVADLAEEILWELELLLAEG